MVEVECFFEGEFFVEYKRRMVEIYIIFMQLFFFCGIWFGFDDWCFVFIENNGNSLICVLIRVILNFSYVFCFFK